MVSPRSQAAGKLICEQVGGQYRVSTSPDLQLRESAELKGVQRLLKQRPGLQELVSKAVSRAFVSRQQFDHVPHLLLGTGAISEDTSKAKAQGLQYVARCQRSVFCGKRPPSVYMTAVQVKPAGLARRGEAFLGEHLRGADSTAQILLQVSVGDRTL